MDDPPGSDGHAPRVEGEAAEAAGARGRGHGVCTRGTNGKAGMALTNITSPGN